MGFRYTYLLMVAFNLQINYLKIYFLRHQALLTFFWPPFSPLFLFSQAIPAASRIQTNRIGGRIRGPSPLIHQWIEFCLQSARALPFKQEVIPGASPSHLQGHSANVPVELTKGGPRINGNLVDGAPPPDILERCEFLEPLSNSTLSDYHWLLTSIQEPGHGLIHKMYQNIISVVKFSGWFNSKLT